MSKQFGRGAAMGGLAMSSLVVLATACGGNGTGDSSGGNAGSNTAGGSANQAAGTSGLAGDGDGAAGATSVGGSDASGGTATTGGAATTGGTATTGGADATGGAGPDAPADSTLGTAVGCNGVYNPDQVLEYHISIPPGDWQALLADTTYSVYFSAQFSCGDGPPLTVGIQRKRSGGAQKVGLKLDMNQYVSGQEFHGLRKLGFENGVSSGSTSDDAAVGDILAEYLGWRLFQRAEVMSSRAAIARVIVNDGEPLAYVNVEPIDKRFLKTRLGENDGWLYKKSGGSGDGLKTHEADGLEDPGAAYFCFWVKGGGACAQPSAQTLASELPERLDIAQMLRLGAINAIISNTDSPLFKDNNYYCYDDPNGKRTYFPWDLDTTMSANVDVIAGGVSGGTTMYTSALFSNWKSDYVAELKLALSASLSSEVISSELDRALSVAGGTLDADPYLDGSAAAAVSSLDDWWKQRLEQVASQL